MDASIVVCTFNRSRLLGQCLASLAGQKIPKQVSWEVVMVDNNSTDDTREMVEKFARESGLVVRYVLERKQGLSFARNRGIREARGSIIAFIDDDSVVDANWLREILKGFSDSSADCVGGKVLPKGWPKKIPKWFKKELHSYVGIFDQGDKPMPLSSPFVTPIGGNVAYRKNVFQKHGVFNTALGRIGANSTYCAEEQELNQRMLKKGGKLFYLPKAIVYHLFRPDFLNKWFFRKMDFHSGEKSALLFFGQYKKRNLFGIPLFIFPQFLRSILRWLKSIAGKGYSNSFRQELYCWHFLGFMWGRLKFSFGNFVKALRGN